MRAMDQLKQRKVRVTIACKNETCCHCVYREIDLWEPEYAVCNLFRDKGGEPTVLTRNAEVGEAVRCKQCLQAEIDGVEEPSGQRESAEETGSGSLPEEGGTP